MSTSISMAIVSAMVAIIASTSANAAPVYSKHQAYEDVRNSIQYVWERAERRSR